MESFNELLRKAEAAHGHLCAGQILDVRMALAGLERLGIVDPHGADRKRLVTYVEIDRCATDAISLVTGCQLGKRTLKFRDWGQDGRHVRRSRIGPRDARCGAGGLAGTGRQLYFHIENENQQQMLACRELPDAQLFHEQRVRVNVAPEELPGYKRDRILCPRCGESVNFGRFFEVEGERLCLSCAHPERRYGVPDETKP